ncbi:MAG: helix-turn-helix transcriptional regulator [Gammaproteobacteria bacterium]
MFYENISLFITSEPSDSDISSRHRILQRLLENKEGWPIDKLVKSLNISRTAVQNHCQTLEKDGLIKKNSRAKTLGRPSVNYALTDKGIAYFPKQYSLFSVSLLKELQNELDSDLLIGLMQKLGKKVAAQYRPHLIGLNEEERLNSLLELMQELGFYADWVSRPEAQAIDINARNCIFHDLVQQVQEVCVFDQTLIAELVDKQVGLRSCMAKGDDVCCFSVRSANNESS